MNSLFSYRLLKKTFPSYLSRDLIYSCFPIGYHTVALSGSGGRGTVPEVRLPVSAVTLLLSLLRVTVPIIQLEFKYALWHLAILLYKVSFIFWPHYLKVDSITWEGYYI